VLLGFEKVEYMYKSLNIQSIQKRICLRRDREITGERVGPVEREELE
jgi:hypothetical protein